MKTKYDWSQDGVAGFGDSPEKAMQDFDSNWIKQPETTVINVIKEVTVESEL